MATSSPLSTPHLELHTLVTPDNDGPAITIAAAFGMSMILLFLIVRLWIRYPLALLFSYDDWIATVATALAALQATLILTAVNLGLGRKSANLSKAQLRRVLDLLYADDILYVITLCVGKLALTLLLFRLSGSHEQRSAASFISYATVAWGVGGTVIVAVGPNVAHPYIARSMFSHGMV